MITKNNSMGVPVLRVPVQCSKCGEYDYAPCDGTDQSLADQIARLEAIVYANEWVPCSVRLPNDEESFTDGRFREFFVTVVTQYNQRQTETATFRHGKWFDAEYGYALEESGYWSTVAWRTRPDPWNPNDGV